MSTMKVIVQRVQQWHLLGRYFVNKWHYDSSKWAERVWYGQGSTRNGPKVASVAFMITHSMRQQLQSAGFPPSVISTLQPATAQKLISDNVMFAHFKDFRKNTQERSNQTLKSEAQHQNALVAAEVKEKADQSATSAMLKTTKKVMEDEEAKKTWN